MSANPEMFISLETDFARISISDAVYKSRKMLVKSNGFKMESLNLRPNLVFFRKVRLYSQKKRLKNRKAIKSTGMRNTFVSKKQ